MRFGRLVGRALAVLLIMSALAAALLYWQLEQRVNRPLQLPTAGMEYWLQPGTSLSRMARQLYRDDVLHHPLALILWSKPRAIQHQLVAGEYHIPAGTTAVGLLAILSGGESLSRSVTLIEGTTLLQAMRNLYAAGLVPKLAHMELAEQRSQLGIDTSYPSMEGLFFPDTYRFQRGMSDLQLLRRAHQKMRTVMQQEWASRDKDLPYNSVYQALILASIVEKETSLPSERKQVAGVLVRRLKKGMRLEADPTTIYGLGEAFDGNLTRADLRDSGNPYNTYRIRALPPTPIALVSQSSLHAALHPDDSDALFFVARGRGDGSHYFSSNLREHRDAVRRYQLKK